MDREREIRYIIDIDIDSKKIVSWSKDLRENLNKNHPDPNTVRIFLTKGQYNKFVEKVEQ